MLVIGLIPGHGGVIDGKYVTAPNKMYIFPDGLEVYEGEINRFIVETTVALSDWEPGIDCINLVPEDKDISLSERVRRIERVKKEQELLGNRFVVFEIHCNAFDGTARGYECFTTRKDNFSDTMANIWIEEMKAQFPDAKCRGHRQKDFKVIRESPAYAVLTEHFFFDNRQDVEENDYPEGYAKHATALIKSFHRIKKLI